MTIVCEPAAALPAIARPVFLVGTIRSGTTLLAELLGHSPDVAHCRFELKDLWSQIGGVPMASPKTRDHVCPELSAKDCQGVATLNLRAALAERVAACSSKAAGAVLLNKNPHLCNKLGLVKAMFPDARFVWIHRGLPQVAGSVKRLFADIRNRQATLHWWPMPGRGTRNRCWNAAFCEQELVAAPADRIFPGGHVRFIAEYWLESNRAVAEYFATMSMAEHIDVAEEALLADPERELGRIARHLGVASGAWSDTVRLLDQGRNATYREILTADELDVLHAFIAEHDSEIERIFTGRRHAFGFDVDVGEA